MTTWKKLIILSAFALLTFAALVGASLDARACSCMARDPQTILASDPVGVLAAVVSPEEISGGTHAYRVHVDRALKGATTGDEMTVVLRRSEAACGGVLEAGRSYVIFGRTGRCGELRVDACQGFWRVDRTHAKELAPLGVTNSSPALASVRDFPKETLEKCNPILEPRNVTATADILSLGAPDPEYHAEMPVRLRIVDTDDPGDANGRLAAGQEIDVKAFFLKIDPQSQTPKSCFGPHNKPGQRVKVRLVAGFDFTNAVGCNVVAPPDSGAHDAVTDGGAHGAVTLDADAARSMPTPTPRGCACSAAPAAESAGTPLAAAALALALVSRRRRRGAAGGPAPVAAPE